MATKSRKFNVPKPEHLRLAREAALRYYVLDRHENGALKTQEEIATEMGIRAPRFSDLLNIAWQNGLIEVTVTPSAGSGINADFEELLRRESELLKKLREISPSLKDAEGKLTRPHKLRKVHIVSNSIGKTFDSSEIDIQQSSDFGSVAARIRRKASRELMKLIEAKYNDQDELHIGIGWGRSCEGVVNLLKSPPKTYKKLICCPLVGMIGHTQNSFDASYLAFRLASRLSAGSIKLPCPIIQDPSGELEKLLPIREALQDMAKCQVGVSAVGTGGLKHSELLQREVFDDEQIQLIQYHGGIAELNGHFFNIEAEPIDSKLLGFKPVGVSVDEMKRIPRYILIVSPDRRKLLPTLIAIKAGICSDLVVDHLMAQEMLEMDLDDHLA